MSFLKRKYVRSVSARYIGLIVIVLASTVNSILTARLLGPSGKGIYFLIYSTLNMIIAAGGIKLMFSQVYFRKHIKLTELAGTSMFLSLTTGIFAALMGLLVVYILRDSVFSEVQWDFVLTAVALVPLLLLATNTRSVLDADYQIGSATIVMAVRPIIFMLAFSILAATGWHSVGSAVTAMTISIFTMVIVAISLLRRSTTISFKNTRKHSRSLLGFSLRSHVGMLFKRMQDRFDVFILAYFMTLADVGIYSVALVISELAGKLSQVTSTVLLGKLAKNKDEKKSIKLTVRLNRIMFFLTVCSATLLALLVEYIIDIAFGEEFSSAVTAVYILLPGVIAVSVFRVLNTNLITSGRPGVFSAITMLGVAIMVGADFILIPKFGIEGAALASTSAYIVTAFVMIIVVVRNNSIPFGEYFNLYPEILVVLNKFKS